MHIIEHHGENPWNSLNKWIVPRILMDFYRGNTSRINGKIPKKQQSLVAFNAGHGRKPETGRIRRIVVNKPMFQFPAVPFRNWLVVDLPLWKIWVNGKDDIQYMMENKIHVWNHQPEINMKTSHNNHHYGWLNQPRLSVCPSPIILFVVGFITARSNHDG